MTYTNRLLFAREHLRVKADDNLKRGHLFPLSRPDVLAVARDWSDGDNGRMMDDLTRLAADVAAEVLTTGGKHG